MFECDIETISRILKLEEFDLDGLNLNQIKHVPMHQYRISSLEKPLLLIENLQVCVMRGDEFQYDANKNIIHCNRLDNLYNAIIDAKIHEPVYIGISMGFNPVEKTYQIVDMLDKAIDNLISKLNTMGIDAAKLDLRENHIFILDSSNGKIITPSKQNIQESIKTK